MIRASDPRSMLRLSQDWRRRGLRVGFVPTMGALHAGHLSLLARARKENGIVVASVFVNPLQFGPKEDFTRYPRPFARDRALCLGAGADALYHPSAKVMYPEGFCTRVSVEGLSGLLCGEFRPGHFQGVATVVLKLLEAVRPDRLYLGEKDFQQLTLLRRMVLDLGLPVKVVGCPTIRERDGLALSSRNAYLSAEERAAAPDIYRALRAGAGAARGRGAGPGSVLKAASRLLSRMPGARVEYLRLVDERGLAQARRLRGRLRLLAAVRLGRTRLIDNVPVICEDRPRNPSDFTK